MSRSFLQKVMFPLPEDQEKQGFEPNFYIKMLRAFANVLIFVFRLNGKNRFSNEFIQMLNPVITTPISKTESLTFRTGHGRLYWRAKAFLKEEPMIIQWIDSFNKRDIFYDIGANIGSYSLYAAKKGIQTFSVEPELHNVCLLYENIFLNNLEDKCMPIPMALDETTNVDTFYLKSVSKGDALHSIGRKSYLLDSAHEVKYKLKTLVITLDELIENFDLPLPTKLKIDVDFNELRVIRGAMKTLQNVQEVYIEIDPKLQEHKEIFKVLESLGFEISKKQKFPSKWNRDIANYIFSKNRIGAKVISFA